MNLRHALLNKLDAVRSTIDAALAETDPAFRASLLREAIEKPRDDILAKLDGCTATGALDRNDWIVACGVQSSLGSALASLIEALERLR